MVSQDSAKDHQGRIVFLTGLGEATGHPSRGRLQRSKQGADSLGKDLKHMLYYGPWMEYFGVLGLRLDWSIQTKKRRVLVREAIGFSSKKEKEKALGGRVDCLS